MILRRLCRYIMLPVVILCFLSSSLVSYAQPQNTYSLTLKFITESGVIEDCNFNVYYALTKDGELYGDFAEMNVSVGDLTDAANVNRLAYTLASYTESGMAVPVASATSDALGHTDFDGLSAGIYLVTGESVVKGKSVFIPKPSLIRVPSGSGEAVVADIKYFHATVAGESASLTVVKQWDDGNDPSRPKSVTVRLLKDGGVYDEKLLSAENNWKYTWDGLDMSFDWTVIEPSVPEGYNVSIVLNDDIYTVTNKKDMPSDTTAPPDTSATTQRPTDAGNAGDGNDRPSLPYTGQWWIPVPILFVAGLILFLISLISERLSDEDEKK